MRYDLIVQKTEDPGSAEKIATVMRAWPEKVEYGVMMFVASDGYGMISVSTREYHIIVTSPEE